MIDTSSGIMIPDSWPCWPVTHLIKAPWNPNKQSAKTFNSLVDNVRIEGFIEPLYVLALDSPELRRKYMTQEQDASGEQFALIVGGHHRYDAAVVLGMTQVPYVLKEGSDEDWAKFQNVRVNMLRGKIDPVKFTGLYHEMVEKYGEQLVREQMSIHEDAELKRMVQSVRDDLPPELQKKVDEAAGDIKTVDDLSRVLNELFSKHGDTLDSNYMVFTFGGKSHLWVQMNRPLMKEIEAVKAFCYNQKADINKVFAMALDGIEEKITANQAALIDEKATPVVPQSDVPLG